MTLLTLSGSLRAASLNTALCRAAAELAPTGTRVVHHDLRGLPLYDGDLAHPAEVRALVAAIEGADAVFMTTPEYNHSVSGVLKNAIDWASRPAFKSCLAGKAVAIASVSPGAIGGARAQQHLRPILASVLANVYAGPEFCVGAAGSRFQDGALVDPDTRERFEQHLAGLMRFASALG